MMIFFAVVILSGCVTHKTREPQKPDYYSPNEIKPTTDKLAIAIPNIENADLKNLESQDVPDILQKLRDSLLKDLAYIDRFDIVDTKNIEVANSSGSDFDTNYLDQLKTADLVLYILATDIDMDKLKIDCGCFFVIRDSRDVQYRFNSSFGYKMVGNEIVFNSDGILGFVLDLSRKFPKMTGKVISRDGNSIKIELVNKDMVFIGQKAIIYTKISPRDPKFLSSEKSIVPICEVKLVQKDQSELIAEITSGGDNTIMPNDIVFFK